MSKCVEIERLILRKIIHRRRLKNKNTKLPKKSALCPKLVIIRTTRSLASRGSATVKYNKYCGSAVRLSLLFLTINAPERIEKRVQSTVDEEEPIAAARPCVQWFAQSGRGHMFAHTAHFLIPVNTERRNLNTQMSDGSIFRAARAV